VAGDPALRLSGVQSLDRATGSDLSWVAHSGRAREAEKSGAGALLVSTEADAYGRPAVVVEQPALAFALWLDRLYPARRPPAGVARGAFVHPSARLGRGVCVAAGATVSAKACIGDRSVVSAGVFVGEDASIGEDCLLHPNAVVLDRCQVGARCILHSGAVIGSDGFGFVWDGAAQRKIPQVGIVRVEDDVEIGANTTIDRATLGETVIGHGTKIDNLVQIGHNVVIGAHSILCGQAGIGGSARLGSRVTLAGQVGVSDHAELGDGAVATGQAGILIGKAVPPGAMVSGMPAAPHREFLRRSAWLARLPELAERVEKLEKSVASPSKGD
jgi:UDP-3-O-[3-hydroxymyristoyl] glucosamine N-acyltransferase